MRRGNGLALDVPLVIDRKLTGGTWATGPGNQRFFYDENALSSARRRDGAVLRPGAVLR